MFQTYDSKQTAHRVADDESEKFFRDSVPKSIRVRIFLLAKMPRQAYDLGYREWAFKIAKNLVSCAVRPLKMFFLVVVHMTATYVL